MKMDSSLSEQARATAGLRAANTWPSCPTSNRFQSHPSSTASFGTERNFKLQFQESSYSPNGESVGFEYKPELNCLSWVTMEKMITSWWPFPFPNWLHVLTFPLSFRGGAPWAWNKSKPREETFPILPPEHQYGSPESKGLAIERAEAEG